jgi:hypothetical protein
MYVLRIPQGTAEINSYRQSLNSVPINNRWNRPSIHSVEQALTGAGALIAFGSRVQNALASTAGAGAIVCRAAVVNAASALFGGVGALTGRTFPQASATFSGSGAISGRASLRATVYQTQFFGNGTFFALRENKATFRGTGVMVANAALVENFFDHAGGGDAVEHVDDAALIDHTAGSATNVHPLNGGLSDHAVGTAPTTHSGAGGLTPHTSGGGASEHSASGDTMEHPAGHPLQRHAA